MILLAVTVNETTQMDETNSVYVSVYYISTRSSQILRGKSNILPLISYFQDATASVEKHEFLLQVFEDNRKKIRKKSGLNRCEFFGQFFSRCDTHHSIVNVILLKAINSPVL
jgi:hypothetical protein